MGRRSGPPLHSGRLNSTLPIYDIHTDMNGKVGVGLVGSQFISTIHAEALRSVPDAAIRAVMSPTVGHASQFAAKYDIPDHFVDLDQMLALDDIDMVVIGAPNFLHCEIALKAAGAGKRGCLCLIADGRPARRPVRVVHAHSSPAMPLASAARRILQRPILLSICRSRRITAESLHLSAQ